MEATRTDNGLPRALQAYIALVGIGGGVFLAYLLQRVEWSPSTLGEAGLFFLLIVAAGSFPLPVAPRVKADVNTAVFFSAALLFEPGVAALAGVAGVSTYTLLIRFWGQRLQLPWYKYPFNAGQVALLMGLTSLAFRALTTGSDPLSVMVIPVAVVYYSVNTVVVSAAVSLQLGLDPLRVWWNGTKENGPMAIALFAFGFLGAVVYQESPWTVVALFIPVATIYIAFSKLASMNERLGEALSNLESLQGRIVSTSKLASLGAISLDLSHQIKNPLTVVIGRLEGLRERLEQGTKERRHLDIALEASLRIEELTHTFTAIGEQRWVAIDLASMLDDAAGMADIRSTKEHHVNRDYQGKPLWIKGNPVLVREALTNLFSNCIDAIDEGGCIDISASLAGDTAIARISDNGSGIPHQCMAHLYEPFNTTKTNGQGLGIFAAKHIVELHKGTVDIESKDGEGTRVTVRFPATLAPEEDAEEHTDSLLSPRLR